MLRMGTTLGTTLVVVQPAWQPATYLVLYNLHLPAGRQMTLVVLLGWFTYRCLF